MDEDQTDTAELTEIEVDYAAEMIHWFHGAVAKLGGDKEPTMPVGQGWLTCPLYHIAPDDAMEADWDENIETHIVYAQRTGLDQGKVLLFYEWYHDDAHHNPDLVELVNEAMNHRVEDEEWSKEARKSKLAENVEQDAADDANAQDER
jgi:hypothetical protein